jgi:neutral amino acid transport system permease protein
VKVIQTVVFGIIQGSFLIVATLGFALVSRVNKFLNIAHSELITVGAFLTFYLQIRVGWNLVPAAVVAIVGVSVLSVIVYRLFYAPIRQAGPVTLLITSVGVLYVLHGILEALIGPGIYGLRLPQLSQLNLGLFRIGPFDLLTIGIAALVLLGLHSLLTRTTFGLQVRAIADNADLAGSRGIDVRRISIYVWLVVGALAGIAGVLLAIESALTTDLAFAQILLIISVSILAGLGSLLGVVAAGLILAVAMNVSTLVIPTGYQSAVAFGAVILVLLIRPEGLSALRGGTRRA